MTNRSTGRRNGRLLLGGGGLLFLTALTWVVLDVEPLRGAQAAAAQAPSDTYKKVYDGWKWWHVYCYRCHGVDATGTPTAPNLTDANNKLGRAEFMKIVKSGVPDKGMQAWDKLLDDKQIGDLFVYVRARADKVLPAGRPDEVGPKGGAWEPPKGWVPR